MRLALLFLLVALPAAAQEGAQLPPPEALRASAPEALSVNTRVGDHPGHGRLVLDWAAPVPFRLSQDGERVVLHVAQAASVQLPRRLPRNVLSVTREDETLVLRVAPGVRVLAFRNGTRLVLDALNAPPATPAAPPAREARPGSPMRDLPPAPGARLAVQATATPSARPAAVAAATRPAAVAAPERPTPSATERAGPPSAEQTIAPLMPVAPVPQVVAPERTMAPAFPRPDMPRVVPEGDGLRVVQAPGGLALFRRGNRHILVLDDLRDLDISRLPPGAEVRRLPEGMLLAWPAGDVMLNPRRDGAGWLLAPGNPAPPPAMLLPEGERAAIPLADAARSHTLEDPETGLPLLVGTLREPSLRQAMPRALPGFTLLETAMGLAVLARADSLTLRAVPGRFLLAMEGATVGLAGGAALPAVEAAGLTRSFDLPALPVPQLVERLRAAQAQLGETPPLRRAAPRLLAAQALLALGQPQEAQAMLRLAAQEVPQAAADPRHQVLSAFAALLAGRLAEAPEGLHALLPPSDELTLWRGLAQAAAGDALGAAPALEASLPLLLAYPEPLRRRLAPLAAEALASALPASPAARRLVDQLAEDQPLPLAQAMLDEAAGEHSRALEGYDAAAEGRDRRVRAQALRRAAELRLAQGQLDATGAARALERSFFAWRGDTGELAVRRRVAALRRQAGDARGAMALLRETEAAFPDHVAELRPDLQAAFLEALQQESPLAAVALHDAQPELLPATAQGEAALATLAERLAALDLPERADGLLRRAVLAHPPGEARAALGARLARQRLAERDAEGALTALGESTAPALPPALTELRAILAARAEARRGRHALAAEALAGLGPAGDEALAEILTEARDFVGAARALTRHLANTTPAQGPLNDAQQRLTLRLAALLALAGEEPGIAALRRSHGPRMADPRLAAALEALTADPVQGLADLPRLARELNLFRSLGQMREPFRVSALPAG